MGILSKLFKSRNDDKDEKFKEFESKFIDDVEMVAFAKATWLTSRGNHFGDCGKLEEAMNDFREAIDIKTDHLPAHLGLAIALEKSGLHDQALGIINSAPEEMIFKGDVVAKKKDLLSSSR